MSLSSPSSKAKSTQLIKQAHWHKKTDHVCSLFGELLFQDTLKMTKINPCIFHDDDLQLVQDRPLRMSYLED